MKIEILKGREYNRDTYTLRVNGFSIRSCGPAFPLKEKTVASFEVDKATFEGEIRRALMVKE